MNETFRKTLKATVVTEPLATQCSHQREVKIRHYGRAIPVVRQCKNYTRDPSGLCRAHRSDTPNNEGGS